MRKLAWMAGFLGLALATTLVYAQPQGAKAPAGPFTVRFEPQKEEVSVGEAGKLFLKVQTDRAAWPAGLKGQVKMDFLLRIPANGVELKSQGWKKEPQEKDDPTGIWAVYTKEVPLTIPAGGPSPVLANEAIDLGVVKEGENWVVTTRARIQSGKQKWQAFNVIFTTRTDDSVTFHAQPRTDHTRLPGQQEALEADAGKVDAKKK